MTPQTKTTNEHTPGPWRIERHADPIAIVGKYMDDKGKIHEFVLAEVGSVSSVTPLDEANARLIAAAPRMYEALEAIVRRCIALRSRQGWKEDSSGWFGPDIHAIENGAVALLATINNGE